MSDWGWVVFAYVVALGSLTAFMLSLSVRIRSARNKLETAEEPR